MSKQKIYVFGPVHGATCQTILNNVCDNFLLIPSGQKFGLYDPRDDQRFINYIGIACTNDLHQHACFMACFIEEQVLAATHCQDLSHFTNFQCNRLDDYINLFWHQFDNAFTANALYVFTEDGRTFGNTPIFLLSNSLSQFDTVELTQAHVNIANDHDLIYHQTLDDDNISIPINPFENVVIDKTQHYSKIFPPTSEKYFYTRALRAQILLKQARLSYLRPIKATFYAVLLECLLSSDDNAEVSHKVAERASFFIGENTDQRISIFKDVKKFYGLRSKFVHGQNIKNDLLELDTLIKSIDEIVRKIFAKILSSKYLFDLYGTKGSVKDFDEYFLKLLFTLN